MALQERALALAAGRIGLGDEPKVIRKALELERLLQTRLISGGVVQEACRYVVCLDLAAGAFGIPVDSVSIVKQSGLKKAAYLNSRSTVERLLDMNETPTVAAVSLKQQCVSAKGLAERILAAYQKEQEIDLLNPQYVSMAVYQACRISKVKVSKNKLVNSSRLKPAQWARLEAEWSKFVDQHFAKDHGVNSAAPAESLLAMCTDGAAAEVEPTADKQITKTEDYESWKERILQAAYRELREIEESERTPRKSPRKRVDTPPRSDGCTPNKLDRSKGVRLLFQ